MLKITIPKVEGFNEETNEFINIIDETELQLEHSLLSLSKWESKWHKPFLSELHPKTEEETIDYIKCMTITQNVNPEVYNHLDQKSINKINEYIKNPMTATTFRELDNKKNREIMTSELFYYAMVSYNIPFECQKWHLNRLIALIRVCSIKNSPEKKMTKKQILEQNRALNNARKAKLHTKG